jgi:hypothetical protein
MATDQHNHGNRRPHFHRGRRGAPCCPRPLGEISRDSDWLCCSATLSICAMELTFSPRILVMLEPAQERIMGRGALLWLIGIPIPIILPVWLLGGLH